MKSNSKVPCHNDNRKNEIIMYNLNNNDEI